MKKSSKILLGFATLWPFLYMVLFFVFVFASILFMPTSGSPESGPPMFFFVIFPLHLLTMLWIMGLTVFYMVNVFRNDRVDKDKKVLWAVVLFLGSMIAMPVYWYLYIWREATPGSFAAPGTLGSGDRPGWTHDVQATNRQQQYVPPSEPPNWRD